MSSGVSVDDSITPPTPVVLGEAGGAMNVLVIGSGAREHAIVRKLAQKEHQMYYVVEGNNIVKAKHGHC